MRQEKIITLLELLSKEDTYKQSDYFANELNVNTKTIHNYCHDLEYLMRKSDLYIDKKSGVGILLCGNKKEVSDVIETIREKYNISYSTKHRRELILEELIMFDSIVSVRKLSDEYNVSKTSIVRDLEIISEELRCKEIELEKTKQGTRVIAKEQRIRSAKRLFIYNKVKKDVGAEDFIGNEKYEQVLLEYVSEAFVYKSKELINYITEELQFNIENNYYIQILIQLSIFLDRITHGQKLLSTPSRPVVTELHVLKTYPISLNVCQMIENTYGIQIGELDVRWVNARIAGVFHERRALDILENNLIIDRIIAEMIHSVKDVFNTDLSEDRILIQGLKKHFIPMVARLTNNIKVSNPFIDQIKEQYTAMYSVVWLACSIIEKEIGFPLSEDEISFILIHFQGAMERRNLSRKIALVSNASEIQTQLMLSRIKGALPIFDVVEVLDELTIKDINADDFDFFISTFPLTNDKILSITVSPVATNLDLERVRDFYEEKIKKPVTNMYTCVLSMLEKDTILLNKSYRSKKDLLQEACSLLVKKGFVKEGYYNSIMNRESNSPTELGNGIAIPHGRDNLVYENKLVFITLSEPIHWGRQMVNVVILLAINFHDKEFSRKIFKDLYHMIGNNDFIRGVCQCKSYEEFKRVFQ